NLEFNTRLREGRLEPVDPDKATMDQFARFATWSDLFNVNGPFDEPSFCYRIGSLAENEGLHRQAIAQFERVCELAPDFLPARYELARIYLVGGVPDR